MVNLLCFFLLGSKCTWMWDSVAEKSAAWKNCSVLWLLERSTRKNSLYIHGIYAWGKQESQSTSTSFSMQYDEHPSRQLLWKCAQILKKCPKLKTVPLTSAYSSLSSPLLVRVFRITVVCTKVLCIPFWQCLWKDYIIISKLLNRPEF